MYDNNFKLEGTIKDRFDTVQVSDKFRKREFVLGVTRPNDSTVDHLKFQCLNDKVDLLDGVRVGYRVIVSFQVTGKRWEKDEDNIVYFINLTCSDIDILDALNLEEHTSDVQQGVLYPDKTDLSEHIIPKEEIENKDDKYSDLPF